MARASRRTPAGNAAKKMPDARSVAERSADPSDIRYEQPPTTQGAHRHNAEQDIQRAAEVARYIAQLTTEMQHLASDARLETLSYFLSLARLEAEMMAREDLLAHPLGEKKD